MERELLIEEVETLLNTRLQKDIVLIETGHDSNRYIRCVYKNNRTTISEFLEGFVAVYGDGLSDEMKADPLRSLLNLLHEKKVLKKDFKPYLRSVSNGFYEEKPSRIYLDSDKNAVRVETDAYITAAGANRLRMNELKPILTASSAI